MTIGITGPASKVPGRNVLAWWIIATIVAVICWLMLRVAGDVLVDWLWFSSVGYSQIFWRTLTAEAAIFFAAFTTTGAFLWLNGWLARRLARRPAPLLILDFRRVASITAAGALLLADMVRSLNAVGVNMILAGLPTKGETKRGHSSAPSTGRQNSRTFTSAT